MQVVLQGTSVLSIHLEDRVPSRKSKERNRHPFWKIPP